MKNDIQATADELAADARLTDYDFWRMLKNLEYEIFRARQRQPAHPVRHAALAQDPQAGALETDRPGELVGFT